MENSNPTPASPKEAENNNAPQDVYSKAIRKAGLLLKEDLLKKLQCMHHALLTRRLVERAFNTLRQGGKKSTDATGSQLAVAKVTNADARYVQTIENAWYIPSTEMVAQVRQMHTALITDALVLRAFNAVRMEQEKAASASTAKEVKNAA